MPDEIKPTLIFGIPKGSLQKATIELFNKAGFHITETERGYVQLIDEGQIVLIYLRAQEISRYVAYNSIDAGITGYDWIKENENESDVVPVAELMYSKTSNKPTRWVLAVSNESKVKKPQDLRNGLVATELVNVTKKYFADKNIDVKVEFSWGATEGKTLLAGVDAIVELTETGLTLKENNLRIIDTVLISTPRLIASKKAWDFKREKIDNISILLIAAINAASRVGLKMNVRKNDLEKVLKLLPAEKSPTISSLADSDYVAVEVVIEDKVERSLVPALKRAGASGIITYPLNKVIH
jgi:ATP phosphoribosyltransferase